MAESQQTSNTEVRAVLLPTAKSSLLIPSNMIAEVMTSADLKPLAGTADWVMGYFVWRERAVPLVCFEGLCGVAAPRLPERIVVFYPLPGRQANDYFAVAARGNPRSVLVGPTSEVRPIPQSIPAGLVGGALQVEDSVALVPNFEIFAGLFYGNA